MFSEKTFFFRSTCSIWKSVCFWGIAKHLLEKVVNKACWTCCAAPLKKTARISISGECCKDEKASGFS